MNLNPSCLRILGIETSCDETGVAVVELANSVPRIVSEELASQIKLHRDYGGVVPELAAREHLTALPIVVDRVLKNSGVTSEALDGIAVTRGPGLKGCLLMGLGFATGLGAALGLPVMGINHIEGHILAPLINNRGLHFPFLALVVSGGHTEIQIVRGVGEYELWARTSDDAAGEAFDKSAALLGFEYPGGAALAERADRVSDTRFTLPKVMREAPGFSFSGLKTAIALLVRDNRAQIEGSTTVRDEVCCAVQTAVLDTLLHKLKLALLETRISQVVVTGGVSANRTLRDTIKSLPGVTAYFPEVRHCMDNGAMIAFAGALRFAAGNLRDRALDPLPRWPVESLAGR